MSVVMNDTDDSPPKDLIDNSNFPVTDSTMELVMKNIYSSCDIHNDNMVPTSKLIEFITPYMLEDLPALENLKTLLDPNKQNVLVSGEKFSEIMNKWANKITNPIDDFNITPSQLDVVDEKNLPFTQSTPRASFGQKLLRNEGLLLNLSNESIYNNISASTHTKENNAEKTVLEENVKKLEYQLHKVLDELDMVKMQLAQTEEQNENLQKDLERCRTRLASEQQINEHLNKNKYNSEDLREEICFGKRRIEELNKKLSHYEKENVLLESYAHKIEKENAELDERLEGYKRREQELKKEMFDMKTELDMKDLDVASITKLNEELKMKLSDKMKLVDQLTNENELLDYKKQSLEKIISNRRFSTASSHYTTCLADECSFLKGTIPIYSSPPQDTPSFSFNSPDFLKKVLAPVSPTIDSPIYPLRNKLARQLGCSTPKISKSSNGSFDSVQKSHSLNDLNNSFSDRSSYEIDDVFYNSNNFTEPNNMPPMSLQDEFTQVYNIFDHKRSKNVPPRNGCPDYEDTINSLDIQDESLQGKILELTEENERLNADLAKLNKDTEDLRQKLAQTLSENETLQESLREMQNSNKTENLLNMLENELNVVKAKLSSKESELGELKNKFNFEAAYKSSQKDLHERNVELTELKQTLETSKGATLKLAERVEELEAELEKSKQLQTLNRNIEQTANQVQEHLNTKSSVLLEVQGLKKKLENTIEAKEKQLQDKTEEITSIKKLLKSEEDTKNMIWRKHKKIHVELESLKVDHEAVSKKLEAALAKSNKEASRNVELLSQVSSLKKDLSNTLHKYNEESDKNLKLNQQVAQLRSELECVRSNQKDDKESINRKLADYETRMQSLEKTNENLAAENELLRNKVKEDGLSEELCNNLSHFQRMLVELETQIRDLENEKEVLRSELEGERKKSDEEVSSESSSTEKSTLECKPRSFEIQKLTIDRLKERVEHLQAQLSNEKSRSEVLRKMLSDSAEGNHEKQSLNAAIDTLKAKLKSQEDNYKSTCLESTKQLEVISSKLAQCEATNANLLEELAQRETSLRKHLEEKKTSDSLIASLTSKIQESDSRHQKLFADLATKEIKLKTSAAENAELRTLLDLAGKKIARFETELEASRGEVDALLGRICEKESRIGLLRKTVEEQEEKLSQAFVEATRKESEYKAFLEKVSKMDGRKEKELLDTEERIKENRGVLGALERELKEVREEVGRERERLESVSEKVFGFINVIADCNEDLSRTCFLASEKWNIDFEDDEKFPSPKISDTLEVEESLLVLNNNIKAAVSLLEVLSSRAPSMMDESEENQITVISNARQCNSNDPKNIKKFTLRPSKLILNRPVSPDSPSVDLQIPFEVPKVERGNGLDSPDSHYREDLSINKTDSLENGIDDHSDNLLSTFPMDLPFQDAFPNVSDNFLEKLGLQEGSPKLNLSRDETEKLFTTFAIQIALDARDVKDRLQKQKVICAKQHKKCFYLIKDISLRLRDHRCIGASDPINPVFVLLEDVRFLLQEIVQSSGQLGILTCENRMVKCWNLVTNYMAMLKQGVAKTASQKSPPNKSLEDKSREGASVEGGNTKLEKNGIGASGKTTLIEGRKEENTENDRKSWFTCMLLAWVLLFALMCLTVIISIHWQCRMTTDNQVCPLDDFIKKIQTGSSPY